MDIRPLVAADVDRVVAAIYRGGWGNLRPQFTFYVQNRVCHPFLVDVDGEFVATATAVAKGASGWLAHVFVTPEHRRRGFGTVATRAAIEQLEALGCRSILLAATDLGRPVYEKLGFEAESEYVVCQGPGLDAVPTDARLRPVSEGDLVTVAALDRDASGEDRPAILRHFSASGWVLAEPDAGVRGFYLPSTWGNGAIVAPNPEVGKILVDLRRAMRGRDQADVPLTAMLPDRNQYGRTYLRQAGFTEQRRTVRMRRGEPIVWRPEHVWGVFSLGLG